MINKYLLILLLISSCTNISDRDEPTVPDEIVIVSWNVQNVFDDIDDGTEYNEYDPGSGDWNTRLYHIRLQNTADILMNIVPGGPDVILLQEIENRNAAETLADDYLSSGKYRYRSVTEAPGQSVQLAVLSRYPIENVVFYSPGLFDDYPLRPVQEVKLDIGGDELIVFNNHWKSRREGDEETEPGRIKSAAVIRERLDNLTVSDCEFILAGDFNEEGLEFYDYPSALSLYRSDASGSGGVICLTDDPDLAGLHEGLLVLYTPWPDSGYPGSYVFDSEWGTPDHFILAPSLFDGNGWEFESFRTGGDPRLFTQDGEPCEWQDWSSCGYSDHLPLVLIIRLKNGESS